MVVYFIFTGLSLAWLFLLFVGPYMLAHHNGFQFFIQIYYLLFSFVCHQKADRSFFAWGFQMPVCVRCFGIYLGIFIGSLIYPVFRKFDNTKIPKYKYLWFFLTPIFFDGICQTLNLYESPSLIRFLTGLISASALVFYALPLFNQIYFRIIKK